MTYIAVWEFHVRSEAIAEFERVYGPEGLWAQLFGRSPDYLGTELLREAGSAGRYLTLDHWSSRGALRQFKDRYGEEYAALDKACERMTTAESMVGDFETTSLPAS